jgi:hypothetical protein
MRVGQGHLNRDIEEANAGRRCVVAAEGGLMICSVGANWRATPVPGMAMMQLVWRQGVAGKKDRLFGPITCWQM